MRKHITLLLLLCALLADTLSAGTPLRRYRVELTDKAPTEYSLARPQDFLSPKALARRQRQHLAVDSTDLPVPAVYLTRLEAAGVKVVGTSRWNNTALVETGDTTRLALVEALPFVRHIIKVWTASDSLPPRDANRKDRISPSDTRLDAYYGAAQNQTGMLGVDALHKAGFRGEGMTIAVIDGGFLNADAIPLLRHVEVMGTHNFVHPGWDVYAEMEHGTSVLSCMAADSPYVMVGTAPAAAYWLFCSEDPDCECPAEEDYWAQAVEYADSVGVDVVNTSLGYYAFDDALGNYRYRDLDGRTSLMSATASMAADKGMVIVCSAGNMGDKPWKKITPPADADAVLTVGAVDAHCRNTNFSSVGHTADGRVKPDVMARGGQAAVIRPDGRVGRANGTSFAAPILCGAVACLWQACPQLTAREIIDLVRASGNRHTVPDNIYGYGIPNFRAAYLNSRN